MGCPCALHIEALHEDEARLALGVAEAELRRLDRKYSHYRDDSLVAELSALAGTDRLFKTDAETAGLLDFAAQMHAQSGGLFDITTGPLTRLWDLRNGQIPSDAAVADALKRTGWHRLFWQSGQLGVPTAGMSLDLGGVVKEYAADRVALLCREAGIAHGMVDLGGDLAVIGMHADGSAWRVGIQSPHDAAEAAAHIEIGAGGLATSGDYARCAIVDGRRYSHIIDPRSGYPVDSYASVSVSGPSCLIAGAAATVAMLLGIDTGATWLTDLGLPHLCLSRTLDPGTCLATRETVPQADEGATPLNQAPSPARGRGPG